MNENHIRRERQDGIDRDKSPGTLSWIYEGIVTFLTRAGYRPERHYMRGGKTAGAASLAKTREMDTEG